MALKDTKFLLVIATLILLTSCGKQVPIENITSTGNTKQAEDQLLNDLNKVVDSVAT
jgi:predicted small lipoprotein YifL